VAPYAELFGPWKGIDTKRIIETCKENPQWNFIFQTKYPLALLDYDFPSNIWIGITVNNQEEVSTAIEVAKGIREKEESLLLFVACEPLLGPIDFGEQGLDAFKWILIGGQKETIREKGRQPQWEWVESLLLQARAAKISVFFQPSLTVTPQEIPRD